MSRAVGAEPSGHGHLRRCTEDDARVPIEQSEQFFVALKRHGKEVEFVRLPAIGHGIFRAKHPMIRKEYFRRMIDWFDRHNT